MFQVLQPENRGDVRHAHRHARMPGIGRLHTVHGKTANGIGREQATLCGKVL
jgi:hypothetical protein